MRVFHAANRALTSNIINNGDTIYCFWSVYTTRMFWNSLRLQEYIRKAVPTDRIRPACSGTHSGYNSIYGRLFPRREYDSHVLELTLAPIIYTEGCSHVDNTTRMFWNSRWLQEYIRKIVPMYRIRLACSGTHSGYKSIYGRLFPRREKFTN